MIKLTYKNFKVTDKALKRLHNVTETAQEELEAWQTDQDEQRVGDPGFYEAKPFVPTFNFEEEDYDITKGPYRIAKEDIKSYKENVDGDTELFTSWDEVIIIDEKIQHLDDIFFGI